MIDFKNIKQVKRSYDDDKFQELSAIEQPTREQRNELSDIKSVKAWVESGALFFEDENKNDWYETQQFFKSETLKILVDENNRIASYSLDVSTFGLVEGFSIYEIQDQDIKKDSYFLDGQVISYEESLTLEQLKQEVSDRLKSARSGILKGVKSKYDSGEADTWETQKQEAEAYLLDSDSPTPFIDTVISITGEGKELLIQSVIANKDKFLLLTAALSGMRQLFNTQIDIAIDAQQLKAIEEMHAAQLTAITGG